MVWSDPCNNTRPYQRPDDRRYTCCGHHCHHLLWSPWPSPAVVTMTITRCGQPSHHPLRSAWPSPVRSSWPSPPVVTIAITRCGHHGHHPLLSAWPSPAVVTMAITRCGQPGRHPLTFRDDRNATCQTRQCAVHGIRAQRSVIRIGAQMQMTRRRIRPICGHDAHAGAVRMRV